MDKKTFGKLPTAVKAFVGIVMIALGALIMIYAGFWSANADVRYLLMVYGLFIGVLYIATAFSQLFEYASDSLQDERDQQELAAKKG